MKKFIIYLFCCLFLFGCVNKIKEFKVKNEIEPVEVISFKKADIDKSGNISPEEFKNVQDKSNVNYIDPMWGFYGVIGMVAILLILSNFIQSKKKQQNG